MYEITIEFISGILKGITHTSKSNCPRTVGKVVKHPIGGSPYKVISCKRIN